MSKDNIIIPNNLDYEMDQCLRSIKDNIGTTSTDSADLSEYVTESTFNSLESLVYSNKSKIDQIETSMEGEYIGEVVDDTSPQLGGDLDLNGNNIDFPTTANISDCLDEDDMSSNSATAIATQQSIKAYVDNTNYPTTSSISITMSANQTGIVTATLTKVTFDTVGWDLGSEWSVANTRFDAGAAGKYVVKAHINWDDNNAGDRYLHIYVNGATAGNERRDGDGSVSVRHNQIFKILDLSQNDYVEIYCYQDSGGNRTISSGLNSYFQMYRIA